LKLGYNVVPVVSHKFDLWSDCAV